MPDISPDDLVTRTHDHLNQYISLADNKASILLTAQVAFLGLFANAVSNLSIEAPIVWWSALMSAGFTVIGVFLSGWVVYPRTPKPETGLFFWENIVEYDSKETFREEFEQLEDGGPREELIEENYDLATVAHNKYHFLRWSLRLTAGTVVFAVIAGVVFLFF
ncbi:Pycsar system effector family protein [Halorarum salinum]|uniref:Pycsar effector protein domain-containing protein n=1 Tax=Halorarum salinum TaxID=2743089 RepID=A0A7D5LAT0_9EURY|nr:Pycsar system effector family protein [Halobaculum salinum]QLG62034.1 hypothetical protein HUG12_09975 [Halobaculum salinum]